MTDKLSTEDFDLLMELVESDHIVAFIGDDGDIYYIADVHATPEHRQHALTAEQVRLMNATGEAD